MFFSDSKRKRRIGENIKKEMKLNELASDNVDNFLTLWVSKSSNIKMPESYEHVPNTRIIQKSIKNQRIKASKRSSQYVRTSRSQMSLKIGVLKNFAIFIGKRLCQRKACAVEYTTL